MDVFVVTGLELGWNCVVGVFNAALVSEKQLLERFPEDKYVVSAEVILCDLEDF